MITREPLFTDSDRERALALDDWESSLCPCGCGMPVAEAHSKHTNFVLERTTCFARKAIEGRKRADQKALEEAKGDPSQLDGVIWYVQDSYPDPEEVADDQ